MSVNLALIPQPHSIRIGAGCFRRPARGTIAIPDHNFFEVARAAYTLFKGYGISSAVRGIRDPVVICRESNLRPGGYRIKIAPTGVFLKAHSVASAFHGLQTLRQIAMQSRNGELPCLTINDWPDFQDRGVYYDVCRGRVPKLERLLEQADLLSQYKINHLQLYIEHTFWFRGNPDIGKGASPLTAEDILQLDAYCRERYIELVPSLASFGHMANVLKHKQYHQLAEDWGIGKYLNPEAPKHRCIRGWTLSPANPKIYDFLDSLFAEFLPLFSSERFNVCCDETWDLGLGQSYQLCRNKGKGRVYLEHIMRLRDLAAKYGKKIQFWGDIIRKYPELISDIPRDVTVLDWGYSHNHNFAAIRDFKKAGLEFFACPGTGSWGSLFPRLHVAMANIHGFAAAGKKNGAKGLLNTDWGDGGHYNFMEFSWHGYLFGAEQSWNMGADPKSFTKRFVKLFLHSNSKALAQAIETLGDVTHLKLDKYYQSVWQHVFFATPDNPIFRESRPWGVVSTNGRISRGRIEWNTVLARRVIRSLEKVRKVLQAETGKSGVDPYEVLPYWIFAVDTISHAARKLAVFGAGGKAFPSVCRALRTEMAGLMKRFEKLWMARNRRSEIRITLARYRRALRALQVAGSQLEQGK